jgi:hypothetical protein
MTNNYAANGNGHKRHEKPQDPTKYPIIEVPYNGKLLPKPRGTLPMNPREISTTNKMAKDGAE